MGRRTVIEEISTTKAHLAGDVDHLRQIWTKLVRTEIVVARGRAAYQESRNLLDALKRAEAMLSLGEPPAE